MRALFGAKALAWAANIESKSTVQEYFIVIVCHFFTFVIGACASIGLENEWKRRFHETKSKGCVRFQRDAEQTGGRECREVRTRELEPSYRETAQLDTLPC